MGSAERPAPVLGSFVRFLGSGGFNTLVTWLLYLALLRRLPYALSFTIAFGCGIALAYALNRYVVFRQSGGAAGPAWVTLIYFGQYLANLALVGLWVEVLGFPVALAPLFAVAATLPLTYLLNRLVFSADRPAERARMRAEVQRLWAGRRRVATVVLVALPLLSLALGALAWLRYGLDLPFYDDWRSYDSWDIDSLDFIYLTRALNDTVTPIGLALDAIFQRLLNGNSVLYQLLSMLIVLGSLLVLQWKLLRAVLGDAWRTALCFVFALLMLQPGSYWGRENLAYQQALPLVFILGALWLGVASPLRAWTVPAVAGLGLLAGLTYISGAFGALAAGMGVVLVASLPPFRARRGDLLWPGAALAAGGLVTAIGQVMLVIVPRHGGTSVAGKALGLPTEADFWWFYLGKLGRSLLLPADAPLLSMCLVLLACAAVVVVAGLGLRMAKSSPEPAAHRTFAAVFAALAAMVLVYLLMVAAGRLNFRPPQVEAPLEIFAYAFQRFHFFWATLLWPWVVAGVLLLAQRQGLPPWIRATGPGAVAVAVAGMVAAGALNHDAVHQREAAAREPTVTCLAGKLQHGELLDCPEFNLPDLRPAFVYARHIGASFTRYFPILPIELGSDAAPAPQFRWSRDAQRVRRSELPAALHSPSGRPGSPRLIVDLGEDLRYCAILDVRGRVRAGSDDHVTVHFRHWGEKAFSAQSALSSPVGPRRPVFHFQIDSPLGFENELGLTPGEEARGHVVEELEVRCRLRLAVDLIQPFFGVRDGKRPPALRNIEPMADGVGRFKAGERPMVVFTTGKTYEMATCRSLEVAVIYRVEREDVVQLFYRPGGARRFTEEHSVTQPVSPRDGMRRVVLVAESPAGFVDELRLDPVRQAQALTFFDIELRCLRRTLRPKRRPPEP
jgi:putative flippase GtrA